MNAIPCILGFTFWILFAGHLRPEGSRWSYVNCRLKITRLASSTYFADLVPCLREELLGLLANNISTDNNMHAGSVAEKDFVTVTFRIDKKVIENLRNESEKSGISMNAVVNQILHHYAEWDSFAQRVGMLPFPKAVLRDIFAKMDVDQITRLASSVGKNTAIDMAIFMKGRIDVLGFISWIESRMRNSGFEVMHRIDSYKGIHTLTIKHDLGKNWSLYLKILLESILAEFFKKPSESITTDSMLLINFSFEMK